MNLSAALVTWQSTLLLALPPQPTHAVPWKYIKPKANDDVKISLNQLQTDKEFNPEFIEG
jgi:hypothetical protein